MSDEKDFQFKMNDIGNYYGGLNIKRDNEGNFWWGIENYDGIRYKPIPESLYNELLKHYSGNEE